MLDILWLASSYIQLVYRDLIVEMKQVLWKLQFDSVVLSFQYTVDVVVIVVMVAYYVDIKLAGDAKEVVGK